MSKTSTFAAAVAAAVAFVGCETPIPPGAERGPHNTMAYDVLVEATPPGARIEANGQFVGETPCHLKIFGDSDGTFHDFGSYYYVVRASPTATNQFAQSRWFRTGHLMTPEDMIPTRIYFDLTRPTPGDGPPPGYYPGPYVYPYPYPYPYYGPGVRLYFGPRYYNRRW